MTEINLKDVNIPKATAKRLPLYLRTFLNLDMEGIDRIRSTQLSQIMQQPPITIRKDFSYFGSLGRKGYGYDVQYMIKVLEEILDVRETKKIAVVGCGNLGKALINNGFRRNENLEIVCAFDNNADVVGDKVGGIVVADMKRFKSVVRDKGVSVAISTVPSQFAQEAVDVIVDADITAILNFAPDRVRVPKNVHVQYIDLTTELLTLILLDEKLGS
ncbi:MAG: redox-sensing transcriptional repressor Rex [Lactobacillales bacterium]|jgi:redox-sensing transcriptional repressor|nr:redox-sensing transcriptional repressor Rex [Lactobacillales bacterium]